MRLPLPSWPAVEGPIVHLTYSGTSGATTVAMSIARGSDVPGRHAYVFFGVEPVRADYVADLAKLGCRWRYVPKRRGPNLRAYRAAAEAIRSFAPAAAVLHGWRALGVAAWVRLGRPAVPMVAVHHGPPTDIGSRWRCTLIAALAGMARRNVAVSQSLAETMGRKALLEWAAGPLVCIPNGLDIEFWRAEPGRLPLAGPVRIGMIGTLDRTKDHPTLLKAVGALLAGGRQIELEIVGGGPEGHRLRKLADELGISERVSFLGDMPRDEVRQYLHGWDVLVHSTHGEGFGLAAVEGMLAGRSVVATAGKGMDEVIEHGRTGLLATEDNPDALAGAIGCVLDDPEMAAAITAAGQEAARANYDAKRMAQAYERLVDEMVE